jgi:hypothetical protein
MDSRILLGKILQRFKDQGFAQVEGYNKFGYIRETHNSVIVSRENGKDTPVPFQKILIGIEAYQSNPDLYNGTPNYLHKLGITHVTSPVWAMLHLLRQHDY